MEDRYDYEFGYDMSDFYHLEFQRLPKFFQFGKLQSRIFIILLIILGIADFLLLAIIPWTAREAGTGIKNVYSGYEFKITVYSMPMFIAILIITLAILFLVFWIIVAKIMDKRAFRKATDNFARYKVDRQSIERQKHRKEQEYYDSLPYK